MPEIKRASNAIKKTGKTLRIGGGRDRGSARVGRR